MLRAAAIATEGPVPFDLIVLSADERHLRRRVLTLQHGERVLVDLPQAKRLKDRDRLVLDDGRHVEVIAADEALYEVRCVDPVRRARIAWALGNRHTQIELRDDAIFLAPDHVLRDMLTQMGASLREVVAPFEPEPSVGGHAHAHGHTHGHMHGHP